MKQIFLTECQALEIAYSIMIHEWLHFGFTHPSQVPLWHWLLFWSWYLPSVTHKAAVKFSGNLQTILYFVLNVKSDTLEALGVWIWAHIISPDFSFSPQSSLAHSHCHMSSQRRFHWRCGCCLTFCNPLTSCFLHFSQNRCTVDKEPAFLT